MKISEAFDLYRHDYMEFRIESIRVLETHEYVKRRIIQAVGNKNISKLTFDDIKSWLDELKKEKCQNSIRNDLTRLRTVLKYLNLRDIKCIKADLVAIPKRTDTVPVFITAEDVERMINNAYSIRNRFVISLLYSSGIRLSEFIKLNRGDIQNRRFTVVGKGGKARLCFIDERTETLMNTYLDKRHDASPALVVSNLHHERMTPTNVQLLVKNTAVRAGIKKKVTPHTLRHSFATNFLQNNGNIRYCQTLLGHASLETTMKYTHVTDCDLEKQYKKFHSI